MAKFKVGEAVAYKQGNWLAFVKEVGPGGLIRLDITPDGENKWYDSRFFEPVIGGREYQRTTTDTSTDDPVNSPSHYGQGKIEAIDYIQDFLTKEEYIGYLRGNIAKYMHRFRYKNGVEDLQKAQWYLGRLIETMRDD